MTEISTIISVSMFAYLATNMDNFAILTALFATYRGDKLSVLAGHLLAVGVTLFVAGLIGEAANAISVQYLGYLGIVPIAMGLFWVYRWFYPKSAEDTQASPVTGGAAVLATFLSLLSNSTDTLLTQAIVFADTAARLDWLVAVSVFAIATLLAAAASYAIRNPRFGPVIEHYAIRIAPFIMIAVGVYVFANTATDVVL
jgi:cadmium resistance protein CadD (predicted permease)